ncbi:response regulator transcription factor [Leptothermofonsia sichuanensis E412]|uniref:two-component system response regulator RppA n=1 Tax=Leptothermofonsia sichuanensis TaxID=2917832 RepID=UPI001CA6BC29|nr:two-component system response regulator RppA [Leptothermofonsia sichuanensis]QZZ21875.1 response regulator transcription factor [Leptothermofonsia sichuanensis E412]
MKILVVEDDPELLEPLNTALSQIGHVVDGVETAEVATWLLEQQDYDLLILDWMLPAGSGIDLCQHYRTIGKTAPVLMLTARDSTGDKVMGLDAGADDYLVKPVDMLELLARVRALGRRSPQWQGSVLRLGDLGLDLSTLTADFQGRQVSLSHREAQLLELFLRHPRQILTRDQIEQALWNWEAEPGHNAITVQIRRLRQRLQVIGCDRWVETVYGVGYRLRELPPDALYG